MRGPLSHWPFGGSHWVRWTNAALLAILTVVPAVWTIPSFDLSSDLCNPVRLLSVSIATSTHTPARTPKLLLLKSRVLRSDVAIDVC